MKKSMKCVAGVLSTMWLLGAGPTLLAQSSGEGAGAGGGDPVVVEKPAGKGGVAAQAKPPRLSAEARAELKQARALVKACRGLTGPERSHRLEAAASKYDGLVARFAKEPRAAAEAAWAAAQLWRRHGSLPLAEKDYLHAASCDAARYAQRGLLGAADMQRRQERLESAFATYAKAEAVDAGTSRAQLARLWVARMLQSSGRLDAAIEKFQAALESAPTVRQSIGAADYLARAWLAKDDLESCEAVLDHIDKVVAAHEARDPIERERLRLALMRMSSRKALQRARDSKNGAAADAVRLDEHRRGRSSRRAVVSGKAKAGWRR
ncbi:MAG: hypothetical protein AB8H80_10675 [Planctomycetota bacterium]